MIYIYIMLKILLGNCMRLNFFIFFSLCFFVHCSYQKICIDSYLH